MGCFDKFVALAFFLAVSDQPDPRFVTPASSAHKLRPSGKCTKNSGLQSALAPMSSRTLLPPFTGIVSQAGRQAGIRPKILLAKYIAKPVYPRLQGLSLAILHQLHSYRHGILLLGTAS
jgi:hypothetical protein